MSEAANTVKEDAALVTNSDGREEAEEPEDIAVVTNSAESPFGPTVCACIKCGKIMTVQERGWKIQKKQTIDGPRCVCPACHTITSNLGRKLVCWPIAEFKGLTEIEQQEFWKDAAKDGVKGAIDLLVHTISRNQIQQNKTMRSGAFLPLSVWNAKGWDTEAIEQNSTPDNIDVNDLGMKCYRVMVKASEEVKIVQDVRTNVSKMMKHKKHKALALEDGDVAEGRKDTKKRKREKNSKTQHSQSSSDSASSSDSSSSSKAKQKKKRKKNKKAKKAKKTKKDKEETSEDDNDKSDDNQPSHKLPRSPPSHPCERCRR